jgi:hypothetical protein
MEPSMIATNEAHDREALATFARGGRIRHDRAPDAGSPSTDPAAAGKTTLADELAAVLRAQGGEVIRASIEGFLLPRS